MPQKKKSPSKPLYSKKDIQHGPEHYSGPRLNPKLSLIAGALLAVLSFWELSVAGFSFNFWLEFIIGAIILIPNSIYLLSGKGSPFGIPYLFTMLRTKKFVDIIIAASHHGKWMEKMSILGLLSGFGLVGVDYWYARPMGGLKRIACLVFSAIVLGAFYYFVLQILFSIPALAPLFLISGIGFVIMGFGGMSLALIVGYAFLSILSLFTQSQICPSVAPVIPGVPIPGLGMMIPAIAWISLALVLIIHETSHGVMMAYYKGKIKSVGLLLAGLIPVGAFVEQDDKTFWKLPKRKIVLALSAGPSSNVFTIIVGLILLQGFYLAITPLAPSFDSEFNKMYDGVEIKSVQDTVSLCGLDYNAPAFGRFFAKDKVVSLNGVDINGVAVLNRAFLDANGTMSFVVLREGKEVAVDVDPVHFKDLNVKRIGVEFAAISTGYEPPMDITLWQIILSSFNSIIIFLILLSFAAGTFNFVPSWPLDGGYMAKIMFLPYFGFMKFKNDGETATFIGRLFLWTFIAAMLLNLIPYITMLLW
ncbi:MAG: site-2 protease family protein [archaeon]